MSLSQNQAAEMEQTINQTLEKLMPTEHRSTPTARFVTQALTTKIPIYYLENGTEREVKCVMMALTLCGLSDDINPMHWQTWVCTWSCLVFPELVSVMRSTLTTGEYNLVKFDQDFVQSCVDALVAQGSASTVGDKFVQFPDALPSASAFPINATLVASISLETLYQYYSMMIFILGKSITPDTVSAISGKRPEALMKKAKSRKGEHILVGDGRIKSDNYGRIQGGWVRSTGPRIIIVGHLASLYASPTKPESLDPIVVNLDMLKNSGQSYFYYIHELLKSHSWCVIEIPALRATWSHYMRMVNILTAQPVHLQPFYKLMMQDADKNLRRKDIEPLVGVAIFVAGQTRASMKNYRITPESAIVVQQFIEIATSKGIKLTEINNQATTEASAV